VFVGQATSAKTLSQAVHDIRQLVVDYRKSNSSLTTEVRALFCTLLSSFFSE